MPRRRPSLFAAVPVLLAAGCGPRAGEAVGDPPSSSDSGDDDGEGAPRGPREVLAYRTATWQVGLGGEKSLATGWGARLRGGDWVCRLWIEWLIEGAGGPVCPECAWRFDARPGTEMITEGEACEWLELESYDGVPFDVDLASSTLGSAAWAAAGFAYDFEYAARGRSPNYMADRALLFANLAQGWEAVARNTRKDYGGRRDIDGNAWQGEAMMYAGHGELDEAAGTLEVVTSW